MDGSLMVYARPFVVRCVGVVVTRALLRLPQVTDKCLNLVIKEDGEELDFTQVSCPSPPSSSVSDSHPPARPWAGEGRPRPCHATELCRSLCGLTNTVCPGSSPLQS